MSIKKRYIVEHTNNHFKQFKRINIRYDKNSNMFLNYIYLACTGKALQGPTDL